MLSLRFLLRSAGLAVLVALLMSATAWAQTGTVTGTVTEEATGEPLPGVNVVVVGTQQGSATNVDGTYEITLEPGTYDLRASFVGFNTQTREGVTVEAGATTEVNFVLSESQQQLEELVVVGYGEQEERDLTGVVQKVNAAEFNQGNVVSPEQLISGKIAGVQISANDGSPGGSSFIRIRGATSINADNQPLFVIDGVPVTNEGNQATRNPLNFLAPGDIENVTVLKDASATAIYGARGANGVIIIETRNADTDEGQITYSGSVSSAAVTDQIDILDANQFRQVVREQAPQMLGMLGDATTDWQDATQRTAYGQEHSLSFSRGYEDSDIRLSLSYLDQQGTLETSTTERVSASLKYNQRFLDDALSLRTTLRGTKSNNGFAPGVVGSAATFAPTQPIRDVNSPYGGFFEWDQDLAEDNPVAQYVLTSNNGETYRSLGNVELEYQLPFVDGLSARANVGYDVTAGEREFFAPTILRSQAQEGEEAGLLERRNFNRLNTLLDAFLTYDNDFESVESSVNVTAGYSYQEFHEEYPEFFARGLNTNIFGPNSTAPVTDAENITSFVTEIPSRLISSFARLNYTFKDRYLLTATVRRDGSSKFGPANQWGTFPSAALAWRVHQESFMEGIEVLSNLKVRASWGVAGNQEIGDFQFEPLFTPGGPQAQVQFGNQFVSTIRPSAADESLKWEETTTTNIGVDFGLFSNRLTGAIEYYVNDTDDLIRTVPVAAGSNLSNQVLTNIGSMRNQGFEVSLEGLVLTTENFSWNAQINASTNDNELLNLDRGDNPDFQGIDVGGIAGGVGNTIQILREGEPINSFFVFRHKRGPNGDPLTDGVDHNGDGVVNDLDMYVDQNGDDIINEQDRVVGESPQPDWILGHTSRMTYGNFDFSFTVRAHLGNHVYNNVASDRGTFNRLTNFAPSNLHESVLTTQFNDPQFFSDYYVEDASFLRMDNISLGYTIRGVPSVNNLRVYGAVQNAFVITGYSGPDPEVPGGIDNNLYPRSRTFTAGVNIQI